MILRNYSATADENRRNNAKLKQYALSQLISRLYSASKHQVVNDQTDITYRRCERRQTVFGEHVSCVVYKRKIHVTLVCLCD